MLGRKSRSGAVALALVVALGVVALRSGSSVGAQQTSVVIAAFIGTRLLKEPFGRRRMAGACAVLAGVIMLHAV